MSYKYVYIFMIYSLFCRFAILMKSMVATSENNMMYYNNALFKKLKKKDYFG